SGGSSAPHPERFECWGSPSSPPSTTSDTLYPLSRLQSNRPAIWPAFVKHQLRLSPALFPMAFQCGVALASLRQTYGGDLSWCTREQLLALVEGNHSTLDR
ncbi:MAG: hypothetical protein ACXVCO_16150, partial [Ktedonobacterales bacterium]